MAYYRVSGYIKNSSAAPIPGVTLNLQSPSGAVVQAETNYLGYYEFTSVEAKSGAYNLWPSRAGLVCTPSIRTFVVDGNKSKDFTAASNPAGRGSFSGTITGVTGTSFRVKRCAAGGSVYVWTYSDPDTGAWKIWWAGGDLGDYTVVAEDPTGTYTLSPASLTASYSGSDITGLNFAAAGTTTTSYELYGYVTNAVGGAAAAGVAVTLTGRTNREEITCLTDSSGKYASAVEPDIFDITPTRTGATFSPTTGSATVTDVAVHGTDFTITYANTGSIAGTLSESPKGAFASLGITSFVVKATDTTSGAQYYAEILSPATYPVPYTINGVPNGTYTVQPEYLPIAGTWSAALTVTVTGGGAQTGKNFTFTETGSGNGSIAGTITLNGAAFAGVEVQLRSGTSSTGTLLSETDTDTSGDYSFTLLANGTYTVVPVKTGYVFSPVTITITTTGAASADNDFTASLSGGTTGDTFSVSGFCYQGTSTGVPGVLVTVGSKSGISDAYGNYVVSGVAPGAYTVKATKTGYSWAVSGWANPVTVGYADVTDIDWLGTGGTSWGGGGSDVAVPYEFTNAHDDYQEAVDADKLNANFDTLADAVNNISDGNVAESAGIDPSKIGSSLGKANLYGDILYLDEQVTAVLEVDPDFVKYSVMPSDEDGIEISGGADGTVAVGAGKHLLLNGKRYELEGKTLPEEGTLAAQSVYALRARVATDDDHKNDEAVTAGDLFLYLEPLAGNALGSGDTGSTRYTVAEVTGGTASTLTISGAGTAPLIGAYGVCLDDSYEKFFIAYQNGGKVMLADALGAIPTVNSRIGLVIDDPSYEDDPGELGGVSTPSDALIAVIWCGSSGQTPYVQKMIKRPYEALGKPTTISSAWSARTTLTDTDEAGYDEVQLTLPTSINGPVQVVSIMCALYDTNSGDPTDATGIFFGPMASLAFKVPAVDNPKGLEMRVTPEKLIARFAKGKLRILSNVAAEGTAVKSACFKAVVTI